MTSLPDWPRAHGPIAARARIRAVPEDFYVEEVLGFAADGEGEHALVTVEKRGANTHWVASQLARFAGVAARDVSYAGLKDRRAVTVQNFTIHLKNRSEPDWSAFRTEEYRLLAAARHRRKLRIGALRGNRFRIVLRDLSGAPGSLVPRLEAIRQQGVPNYFGVQRFGREGGNLSRAAAFLAGNSPVRDRRVRGLLLSAARSFLFNAILARRVESGSWNVLLPGEVLMLDGRRSLFAADPADAQLVPRVAAGELHPTGALWGRGESMASGTVRELEGAVAQEHAVFSSGLEAQGMEAARRALRLRATDFSWQVEDPEKLTLEFFLPAGAYATTVLRELVQTDQEEDERDAGED